MVDRLKEFIGDRVCEVASYKRAWEILRESLDAYNRGANRNAIPTHYLLKQMDRIETAVKEQGNGHD